MKHAFWMILLVATPAFSAGKTIKDYFLALPDASLGLMTEQGRPPTALQRRNGITLEDAKNGYLEANGQDERGTKLVVALFLRKSGSPLLAVTFDNDFHRLQVFDTADGTDVSARVLPDLSERTLDELCFKLDPSLKKSGSKPSDNASESVVFYRLPRQGRTIRALGGAAAGKNLHNRLLFTLTFDGERFVRGEP